MTAEQLSQCPQCGMPQPAGKSFCADCGARLHSPSDPGNTLQPGIESYIDHVLGSRFKDHRLVELELAEAVLERLTKWAKLYGFFVLLPLAVLLGVVGIRTYSDVAGVVEKGKRDITATYDKERRRAQAEADTLSKRMAASRSIGDSLSRQGADLRQRYAQLESDLGSVASIAGNVKALAGKVSRLEERIGFVPSKVLGAPLQAKLQATFGRFLEYLGGLGYAEGGGKVMVEIDPDSNYLNAHYEPVPPKVVIGLRFAKAMDDYVVHREYGHHVLSTLFRVPINTPVLAGIESGVVDYLAASFAGTPRLGEKLVKAIPRESGFDQPYVRNLENDSAFPAESLAARHHQAGEVWGGALWQLREEFGKETVDRVVFEAWKAFGAAPPRARFPQAFVEHLRTQARRLGNERLAEKTVAEFAARGLTLTE